MSSFKGNDKSLIKLFLDSNSGGQYITIFTYIIWNKLPFMNSSFLSIFVKGTATLKKNITKMKDILFPNILVQVS